VVLVAGGTGGLGRAVSGAFLREGATVVVTYRSEKELAELADLAATDAQRLTGRLVDVTDEVAARQLVGGILESHGRIDALLNTVGGYAGGVHLWDLEPGVLDRMLALNLRAGFVLARAAVPAMLKQGSGCIVNVAAQAAFAHPAGAAAYAASKAAAVALIESLAAELVGSGVRVNTILPSVIDTEANRRAMPDADFAKWPKPEDIARVMLFLCSDGARSIHGASIPVSGY
jgi:NAD(P)-dependent dehydrogenase (short-subunit alcohol dehydrogenase family)